MCCCRLLQTLAQVAEEPEADDDRNRSTFVIPMQAQSLRGVIEEIMGSQPEELTLLEEFVFKATKLSWSSVVQNEEKLSSRSGTSARRKNIPV